MTTMQSGQTGISSHTHQSTHVFDSPKVDMEVLNCLFTVVSPEYHEDSLMSGPDISRLPWPICYIINMYLPLSITRPQSFAYTL
jgi:hypothetical protein